MISLRASDKKPFDGKLVLKQSISLIVFDSFSLRNSFSYDNLPINLVCGEFELGVISESIFFISGFGKHFTDKTMKGRNSTIKISKILLENI